MNQISTVIYGKFEEGWSATPSTTLLQRINQRDRSERGTSRWIAVLEREGYRTIRVALGSPTPGFEPTLEIPSWLLDTIEYGEEVVIKYEKAEHFKKATKLIFRALTEPTEEEFAIQDFLEQPLSELGILEEGQMIQVPILEIPLYLEKVEPSGDPVFLDGAEVALEILWPERERGFSSSTQKSEKKSDEKSEEKRDEDFTSMLPMNVPGVKEFYSSTKFSGTAYRIKSS